MITHRLTHRCLAAVPLLFILFPTNFAQQEKGFITRLEHELPRLMSIADIPGLSIAVIRNGKITWSHGFGVKNADTKEPVNDNTVFEAASLSKPVFAYAVLKLVDSGKISLDTPLVKYLPGRYDVGEDPRLDLITARHVLSHTTGFPNWRPRGDTTLKINFTPGERFSYSGEGFVYLSKVVEHITGEPLNEFMKRTVLDPLEMTSSSYVWQDDYDKRKTFAHNSVGGVSGRGKPERFNAAASLHTTATEYARFVCEMIRIAKRNQSSDAMSQMLTRQIRVPEDRSTPNSPPSSTISWGLGWALEKTNDDTSFWHWGDNGDAKAYIVASSAQESGVVMFANSANGLSILHEVVNETIGGQHPAIAWINYESYNSPARLMLKSILASDAETVLSDYRKKMAEKLPAVDSPGNGQISTTKKQRPETVRLTEAQMNRLGYQLLGLKRVKDAIAVFTQNTVDFPNAFNTWDSLAEAFMISGDKPLAIKYYKKSLELNAENTNAVQKLKELEADNQAQPQP